VAKHAAKLRALTVELPSGLSFVTHKSGKHQRITGVTLAGAAIKSLALSHGHLVITLRKAVSSLTVTITSTALKESATLKRKAKAGKLRSLRLTVITTNTKAKRTTIRVLIAHPGV